MKKLFILCCLFLLTSCNHNNTIEEPLAQSTRPLTSEANTPFTSEDISALEETMMNDTRAYHMDENYFITSFAEETEPIFSVSSQLSNDIEQLAEVAQAQVILLGDKAYVALQTNDALSPTTKATIENLIKTSQAHINDIYISTDNELVSRFNTFVTDIENNVPLKELYVDFSTSIENMLDPQK